MFDEKEVQSFSRLTNRKRVKKETDKTKLFEQDGEQQ